MGAVSIAYRYFKRIYKDVTKLSALSGYNRFYHLFDYASAFLFHGVHIDQYTVGDLWRCSNPERSKRLTLYRLSRLFREYNDSSYFHLLRNKEEFNAFFKDYVHRGWILLQENGFEDFKAFVQQYPSVIVKPSDGIQGKGIRQFVYSGEDDTRLHQLYDEWLSEKAMVEETVVQHHDMNFRNASVNTIRVLTVCRPDGKARVMKAILRAGVGDSIVDNTALGGYYYEVDLPTGVIVSKGINKEGDLCVIHPASDIVMPGFKVPHWDKVMQASLDAARKIYQVALIGWDVAITEDGIEMIEGNDNADYLAYEFVGTSGFYEKITSFLKE